MKLPRGIRAYFLGWKNFAGSCLYLILWQMVLALPLIPFVLLVPDQLEGNAPGASVVRTVALVAMVLWVPLISYKLGMLVFESDVKR